ncbi:ribonuclease H-like domain-containing protein [Tanacetum coccineum]
MFSSIFLSSTRSSLAALMLNQQHTAMRRLSTVKLRDYDLWSMRMEQYLTHTDYALWEVIMNGDAPAIASASTEGPILPKTVEQKLARKNELKAKSTLLLAIPDEHLLKFHGIKDEKTLWEAIKAKFGGNKESKKMQKTILKQQYENFTTSRFEGLDKTYDRFQKLISQLEIQGEVISQEDVNLKLLRILPSAWNNIALIMRNKANLDELSMDDLYNNLKMILAVLMKQLILLMMFLLLGQRDKIDTDDLEEMDLKWQVAMLTIRVKRFLKKTGRNLNFNGKETVGFDKTKVECYNCHRRGHFARECRAPRNQGNRNGDAPRRIVPVETPANALVVQDGIGGYDWSYQAEEGPTDFALMAHLSSGSSSSSSSDSEVHTCSKDCLKSYETLQKQYDQQRDALKKYNLEIIGYQLGLELLETKIVVHKKNEAVYEEDIPFLKYGVKVRDNSIIELKNQLTKALREKDNLKLKLEKFETSSMKLTKLINTEEFKSASNSSVNEIVEENNQVNDRFKKVEGYHAVTLPYTGNYMPSRPDLSFAGLDDYVYKTNVSETISSVPRIESTASNSSKDSLEQPKDVRPSPLIIEEWESNSDDDSVATKSELVPVNAAKQSSPRAAVSNSTARYINTAASRPTINGAKPSSNVFHKSHSSVKRTFYQRTTPKNSDFKEKVNTDKVNNVTTARTKAIVSVVQGHEENIVKSSACWFWRPTGKVIDHISKDSGSYMPKRFDYVDPQGRLKLSRRLRRICCICWNSKKKKGGKITRKGKIRTGKLDFEDVYFVKELKFNLFSISQICDKKNNVLFTKTECLVLSPDFKLLDESQVLLKVPRQKLNVQFDLKNVVPLGGLTCLFAKATIYESNLWHRRLGHSTNDKDADKVPDKGDDHVSQRNGQEKEGRASNKENDQHVHDVRTELDSLLDHWRHKFINSNKMDDQVSEQHLLWSTYTSKDRGENKITKIIKTDYLPKFGTLVNLPNGKRAIGTKWVFRNNKDEGGVVIRNKARLVAQCYTQEEGINYDEIFAPVARIYAQLQGRCVMDDISLDASGVNIRKEGIKFDAQKIPDEFYGGTHFLLRIASTIEGDGIFISQDKYVAEILKKFDFATVKTASTPMEPNKALVKDEEADSVMFIYTDQMNLLISRLSISVHIDYTLLNSVLPPVIARPAPPDARTPYRVPPDLHILYYTIWNAVKRIFRYLKGQPKLGLWYPRDSSFDLDSLFQDVVLIGAILTGNPTNWIERLSISLARRLISWQCKKQTIVANSTTEAEYVAAANCYGQGRLMVYKCSGLYTSAIWIDVGRKPGKGFSGRVTPLFQNMLVPPVVVGEGSEQPPEPQPIPSTAPPEVLSQVTTAAAS